MTISFARISCKRLESAALPLRHSACTDMRMTEEGFEPPTYR